MPLVEAVRELAGIPPPPPPSQPPSPSPPPPTPPPPTSPSPRHPPFAPLPAGATIVSTPATVVALSLTIGGDLTSFDAAQEASLKSTLEAELGCLPPACLLELTLSGASISVEARLPRTLKGRARKPQ